MSYKPSNNYPATLQPEKVGIKMNFKEYSQRFLNERNPEGDLARDMNSDGGFPETKSFESVENYLLYMGAAYEVIMIAKEMFSRYEEEIL